MGPVQAASKVTISGGVAAGSGGEIRYGRLFRAADRALLAAKRGGRDRVETAGEPHPAMAPGERELDGDRSFART
jgi:hypothetical protein